MPTNYSGYAAFDMIGDSSFLGFDNTKIFDDVTLSKIILGYARNTWGVSLNISINKMFTGYEKYSYKESHDGLGGNNIGLNLSVPLGNYIFHTRTNLTTEDNSRNINEHRQETSTKKASIGITGGKKFYLQHLKPTNGYSFCG